MAANLRTSKREEQKEAEKEVVKEEPDASRVAIFRPRIQ